MNCFVTDAQSHIASWGIGRFVGPPVGIPPLPQLDFRCTLRGAIQEANLLPGPDEIVLGAGTAYVSSVQWPHEDDDAGAVGDLDVHEDLEISGAGVDATTIDVIGGWGLDLHNGSVVLEGLTVAGDPALPLGVTGIQLRTGVLELSDVRLRDWAGASTALHGFTGTTVLAGDTVFASDVRADAIVLTDVRVEYGSVVADDTTVLDSTFLGDASAPFGLILTGDAWVEGSTFTGHGQSALTVWGTVSGLVDVRNSTFSGANEAVLAITGATTLEHVTITGSAEVGVRSTTEAVVVFDHTIVANSQLADCDLNAISFSLYSLDSDGSCGFDDPTDLPGRDPRLGGLADNGGPTLTHALQSGSPARNNGALGCAVPTDQRGQPRAMACDIGAFEAQSTGASCGLGIELVAAIPLLWALRRRRGHR